MDGPLRNHLELPLINQVAAMMLAVLAVLEPATALVAGPARPGRAGPGTSAVAGSRFAAPLRPAVTRTLARNAAARVTMQLDGTGSLRDVQEYPATLDIKVIGENEGPFVGASHPNIRGPFVDDMLKLCAAITDQDERDVPVRWRDRGKYRSVTLSLRFENADQVYAVYAALDKDPRVRYKL